MLLLYALINVVSVVGGSLALVRVGISISSKDRKQIKLFSVMAAVLLVAGAMTFPHLIEYDKNIKQRIIDQKNDRAEKCQALSNMEDRIVCRIEASR